MLLKVANRWQAFGIHILISLLIFVVLAAVIYFWWYPGFLFRYDGGLEGIKLIAGVDFIIGPVLTLCVYKLGKKSLPFDLAAIGLLQAACLVGGMWTVWQTRPIAVVYAATQVLSIPYGVYRDYDVNPADVPLLQGKWPVWIAVDLSPEEVAKALHPVYKHVLRDHSVFFQTDRYRPLSSRLDQLSSAGMSLEEIRKLPDVVTVPDATYAPSVHFYAAGLGSGSGYMAIDTTNGEVVDFVSAMRREKSLLDRVRQAQVMLMQFINGLMK